MKKKIIISIIISLICLLILPITVISFGFAIPAQYDETYYGELPFMFERLKTTKDKKIVLIGNSSIAFGLLPELVEESISNEFKVVSFGLYGAIGTKTMMDLSKVNIGKDDIVIVIPEITAQGSSLYFSSENTWMGIDGHYEMFKYLAKNNKKSMVGYFPSFVSKKINYLREGKKPTVEGVYRQDSFNKDGEEVGYMTYQRDYNLMVGAYDQNTPIIFDQSYLSKEFIDYLNDYGAYIKNKKATLYYGFGPMNSLALSSNKEEIDGYYNLLDKKLNFPILGNPHNYLFDYDWFYDNNFHVNSAGMYVYCYQLVEDLKIILGDVSPNNIEIPEKPVIPVIDYEDGDNSDLTCFEYEEYSSGYKISKMTEEGLKKTSIIIPSTYNNLPIITFDKDVFTNNEKIIEIIVPKNTHYLPDFAFVGCNNLTKIVLQHDLPGEIGVGTALLDGADNAYVYVKSDAYENFVNHYSWAGYRDRTKKY